MTVLGGTAQKVAICQTSPEASLSDQIDRTKCPDDFLKVSEKKIDCFPPHSDRKVKIFFIGDCDPNILI